jgi:simple sugar transport system permease protein
MPQDALAKLVQGSVGSKNAWNETLKQTAPLIFAGLAVFIALRAGLFNIGAEGQILVGALATTVVALNVEGPAGAILGIHAGVVAGALWALPAGWIKAYRNGHEVISTIMLNNVAAVFALYVVNGPLRHTGSSTAEIDPSGWIQPIYSDPPFRFSPIILLAIALVAITAYWLRKTVSGYELKACGANPRAAQFAGIDTKRTTLRAMGLSGGIAGLAGSLQVLAYEHNFFAGFSSNYGFDALGVALLAGNSPWGVVPSGFLFGALSKGTSSLQIIGVPKGLSGMLLAVLIIVFAAYRFRRVPAHG